MTVLASPSDSFTAKTRGVRGEVLPALPEGRDEWLERLASLGEVAVLTGSDQASELLARDAASLGEGVHAFEAADEAHLPLMSKPTSYEIADRAGVRRPWSAFVNTSEQLAAAARDATYPCIMKPALSHEWRALFGDDRVILANGPEELHPRERAGPRGAAGDHRERVRARRGRLRGGGHPGAR